MSASGTGQNQSFFMFGGLLFARRVSVRSRSTWEIYVLAKNAGALYERAGPSGRI